MSTHFFGDSNTVGYGLSDPATRWSTLLAEAKGWTEDNQAVSGSQIIDAGEADAITATTILSSDVSVWLAGYNDSGFYGANAGALSDNLTAVKSLAAWLAIPTNQRVPAADPSISYAGTWTSGAVLGGLKYSSSTGATASFTAAGTSIIIGIALSAPGTSAFTVTVDGVSQAGSCVKLAPATATGRGYQPGAVVITGLPSGSHTVVLTATSADFVYLCWYAGVSAPPGPVVYLTGTPRRVPGFYSTPAPFDQGSDATADSYSSLLQSAAAALRAAGLTVYAKKILLNTASDYQADGIHFNPAGHASFAAQMQDYIAAPISSVTSVTVSPTSVTLYGGQTQQFTATVIGSDGVSQAVTWSGASNGLFTAPGGLASGPQTFSPIATSTVDPSKSGAATVTVPAHTAGGGGFGGSAILGLP